ncbi:MAG TPA: UDP-N-acetylmuramoyl-tripeptide--D-alanyl-D-alanine ligase [Solirubrobacteraceae bacterium]|nr:UDP-N-acetylmuramoyl-tripeptide--D-alanyl-D-alanine ligase [Solirubrobacteraceae bacterium]
MKAWDAQSVAEAAGATVHRWPAAGAARGGPAGVAIDSRAVSGGELFVGLRGERADGGEHAADALAAGAWGVLVSPEHAAACETAGDGGVVLVHARPLEGLQALARAWRRELGARGAKVVGITGSTGKTSTKDILAALAGARRRTASSPQNLNTEIGLPLALLAAPSDTEVVVLEMAMRGVGQIAELTAIAEPDVGVIVNVGPVHLELLGTIEAIAAAKAELIAGLAPRSTVVVPAGEPLLAPHLRPDLNTVTFGEGGDVALEQVRPDGEVVIGAHGREIALRPSFGQAHNLRNLLAAVAAALALGIDHSEIGEGGGLHVRFSALRGERLTLPGGVVVINDCYNANPMSMRSAIDDLASTAPARRVAVLGDMLELGPEAPRLHREIGLYAAERGVDLLVTVGPLAAEMRSEFAGESYAVADAGAAAELLQTLLHRGDTMLVKGSRGVGLERVTAALDAWRGQANEGSGAPAGAFRRR